jgi:hypothetical protein
MPADRSALRELPVPDFKNVFSEVADADWIVDDE